MRASERASARDREGARERGRERGSERAREGAREGDREGRRERGRERGRERERACVYFALDGRPRTTSTQHLICVCASARTYACAYVSVCVLARAHLPHFAVP